MILPACNWNRKRKTSWASPSAGWWYRSRPAATLRSCWKQRCAPRSCSCAASTPPRSSLPSNRPPSTPARRRACENMGCHRHSGGLNYAPFSPEHNPGDPMKRLAIATATLLFAAISAPAALAETQQERMTQCNADAKAKNLSGDARKTFMSNCLSGKNDAATPAAPATQSTAATPTTQQEKMTACNKEASAKGLKGDERKAFMSSCLKG